MILRNISSYEKTEYGYLLHGDHADVKLVFLSDSIIRIRVSFERQFREASYALVTTAWEDELDTLFADERTRIDPLSVPVKDQDGYLVFRTDKVILLLRKEDCCFSLFDKAGSKLCSDLPGRSYEKDQLGRVSHYICMDPVHDHFYGFGEKTGKLDKKGRRMRMNPKDSIGLDPEQGDPLYKHIPFYIYTNDCCQQAVGLFYNNSYDCVFDMGNEISGYWPRYAYYQADGGDIDLFLCYGPSAAQVVDEYTQLTGRPALPLKQSLGFSLTTMYYCELEKDCDKEIERVIEEFEAQDLPIDNFWMGSGYSSGEEDNLRYVFNWNRKRFPNPEDYIDAMKQHHVSVMPNLKPGLLEKNPSLPQFEAAGGLVMDADGRQAYVGRWWGGPGRFVDFTGEAGRKTWKSLLKKQILEKGAIGIWNDNCEYDGVEDRTARCSAEGKGGTMAELKIIQSNMMAYTAKQASEETFPGERPYIVSRAGYAGIQRYAQVWDGDNRTGWDSLRYNIATVVGMGLSGVANTGEDIGGFAGPAPDAELFTRWIQSGIFMPRFCVNSANSDNTVTQPFMYPEMMPYIRKAMWKRYEMLPYLYSQMYKAYKDGSPVLRPLFAEFPEDPACYTDDSMTFLFGRSVLVANVIEQGAATRTLYLPKGCTWYDMNHHYQALEGGQTVTVDADLSEIPMFLRSDAVWYTSGDIRKIETDSVHRLDLVVSAQKDCSDIYYDDDGHTTGYLRGEYAEVKITVTAGERTRITFDKTGSFPLGLEYMTIKLLAKERGAVDVTLDDQKLSRFLIEHLWKESTAGWYYDLTDRTILIRFEVPKKNHFEICVNSEHFDLIGMTRDVQLTNLLQ